MKSMERFFRELCLIPDLTLHELRMVFNLKAKMGAQGSSKKIFFESLISDLMLSEEAGRKALSGLVEKKILRNTKFFRKDTPMIFSFLPPEDWHKRLGEEEEKAIQATMGRVFRSKHLYGYSLTKECVAKCATFWGFFQDYKQTSISPFKAALRRLEIMEEQQKLKGTFFDEKAMAERAKAKEHALKKRAVIEALRKDEDLFDFLFEKLEEKKIQKKEEVDKRLEQKFKVILPPPSASRSRRSSSTQAARA